MSPFTASALVCFLMAIIQIPLFPNPLNVISCFICLVIGFLILYLDKL